MRSGVCSLLTLSLFVTSRVTSVVSPCATLQVLQSLGMRDIAIGQAERIFISSARKAALGKRDAQLVIKPPPAAPVVVPHLDVVAAALRRFRSDDGGRDEHCEWDETDFGFDARLGASLDATELLAASFVHLKGFVNPAEAEAIALSLASLAVRVTRLDVSGLQEDT